MAQIKRMLEVFVRSNADGGWDLDDFIRVIGGIRG